MLYILSITVRDLLCTVLITNCTEQWKRICTAVLVLLYVPLVVAFVVLNKLGKGNQITFTDEKERLKKNLDDEKLYMFGKNTKCSNK